MYEKGVAVAVKLYAWQKECLENWFAGGTHGIVNVVTGAGKTVMAIAAIRRLDRELPGILRVRIVVPTQEIMKQWRNALREHAAAASQEIGYCYGCRKDAPERKYMIYVINSARFCLARHIAADLEQGVHILLIADECHHYISPENRKIFDFLPLLKNRENQYHSLGLSATPPENGSKTILSQALGKEIYEYGFSEAVQKRTVSPFSILQVALSFTPEERAEYEELSERMAECLRKLEKRCPAVKKPERAGFFCLLERLCREGGEEGELAERLLFLIYKRKETLCQAQARRFCTLHIIRQLPVRTKILVFGERIRQVDEIYAMLREYFPGAVGCYHSQTGEQARRHAIEAFRDGRFRILVTCRALDEGIDVPEASVGIILSGAAVKRQRIQRLGRILRVTPGKEGACLYYLYVEKSHEESSYFSDGAKYYRVGRLTYHAAEDIFVNPEYEEAAAQVLRSMEQAGMKKEQCREARRCMEEGLIRSDWLLPADRCEENLRRAVDKRERNYWVCMRELAKLTGEPVSFD